MKPLLAILVTVVLAPLMVAGALLLVYGVFASFTSGGDNSVLGWVAFGPAGGSAAGFFLGAIGGGMAYGSFVGITRSWRWALADDSAA